MSPKRIILYHQKDNSPPTGEDGLGLYFRWHFMKRLFKDYRTKWIHLTTSARAEFFGSLRNNRYLLFMQPVDCLHGCYSGGCCRDMCIHSPVKFPYLFLILN